MGSPLKIRYKGDYKRLNTYLNKLLTIISMDKLTRAGEEGVRALEKYTPRDTGKTAESWSYIIEKDPSNDRVVLSFENSNIEKYVNVALILQYGHATGTGGWVEGVDYINPALVPVFDKILKDLWEEVE